jgi:hypothetical protein
MSVILGGAVFAIALGSGWLLARALTAGAWQGQRWASVLVELSIGSLFGPGLASVLYFALVAAGVASRGSVLGMLVALLAASAGLWWKLTPVIPISEAPAANPGKRFPYLWVLWIAVAVGLVFFFLDFQAASSANPAGEWDAMAIWNLRARYLASGGDFWRRAVSPEMGGHMTGAAHPGYPLFLSGFIAIQWSAAGSVDEIVPITASLLFAAALLTLLGASLASRRSVALGLLAWLVLLASEVFASQTAAQYSDLLQGLAFLGGLVLLEAANMVNPAQRRIQARVLTAVGLAIGLSCWIKNEGVPFALAALGVAVWRFRSRGIVWLAAGALPGFLAIVVLKVFFVHGSEATFPKTMGEAMEKIVEAGRWWQAALGFGKAVFDAGSPWSHPVLLAAALAMALRFVPAAERRARLWLWIPISATAAAEYGLYLMTNADLNWHISTSISRLAAQLWPSLIWLFFLLLRAPEDAFESTQPAQARSSPGFSDSGSRRKRR